MDMYINIKSDISHFNNTSMTRVERLFSKDLKNATAIIIAW